VLNNKASGAVRCRHPPQARPGGGALPTPSEPRGSCTRKRRDVPADDAPGRPFTARPAPPPCHEPPRTRSSVRQDSCLFSTDPRPRRSDRPVGRRRRLRGLPGRTDGGRPGERPQAHRKAGLIENGLASHLNHRSRPHRNAAATATDAGQPALGRAATARGPATPTLSLLGRAAIGARPDALAYWWNTDPNPSSQQPVCRYSVADSCAWIPKQRTIHRPLIHEVVHKAAVALT